MPRFYEVAIEPAAIDTWRTLQLVEKSFGFNRGRLISNFPRKGRTKKDKENNWRWMVLQAIRNTPGEAGKATKAEEMLIRSFKNKLFTAPRDYDHDDEWLQNARKSHGGKAFDGIICRDRIKAGITHALDDLDPESEGCPEFWKDVHSFQLCKRSAVMASTFSPLLRASRQIALVDPYFDPREPKYERAIGHLINEALKVNPKNPQVEVHFKNQGRITDRDYKTSAELLKLCDEKLGIWIPKGCRVQFHVWSDGTKRFHARYILTDLAGVSAEHGLDEVANDAERFEFLLMAEPHRVEIMKQFEGGGDGTFDLDDEGSIEVEGKR